VNVIYEETQGNPFFVEEVYKHLVEEGKIFDAAGQFRLDISIDEVDVPDNVRLVLDRRLNRLGEKTLQVLAAAAVIGRSFVTAQLGWVRLSWMRFSDKQHANNGKSSAATRG
jgi:predicted ATPase